MSTTHIKAYRKLSNAAITAICNPSGRRLDGDLSDVQGNIGSQEPLKLDMSQVKAYRHLDELLEDPNVDLVDICSPTHHHADHAVKALHSGKHVLCEKPLTRHAQSAEPILKAAAEAKGCFMTAMCLRFWPDWQFLKEAVTDERYGKLLGARFRRVAEPPAWGGDNYFDGTKSGGALVDLHIHDTDFIQFLFGRPEGVYSTGYSKFSGAVDHVVTQYKVADGAMVFAEGGWAMTPGFGFTMSYTANFERATIDYDIGRGAEALKVYQEGKAPETPDVGGGDGYYGELKYLIDCIEQGARPTIITPEEGKSAVEICEAEERSVQSKEFVRL